jgi:DNA-3-methyladenine glycosylase
MKKILKKSFYERDTVAVAQDLIGKILIRRWRDHILSGIIVETEAYGHDSDPASHAYIGPTQRNKAMFGDPGYSYVYFSYGNHYCFNIVAKEKDIEAGGVLLRSVIPVDGRTQMHKLRNTELVAEIANGPGKIGQAFRITLSNNYIDMTKKGSIYVVEGLNIDKKDILATPRIGISKAQEKLWRFIVKDELNDVLLLKEI